MTISQQSRYLMPAEWEPHSAVWLAWPRDKISFGSLNQKGAKFNPDRLPNVERAFNQILSALEGSEQINLLVKNAKQHSYKLENLRMFKADYADVWTRDYMPIFLKSSGGGLTAVKFEYNAYGEKFRALIKDNKVWDEVNKKLKIQTIKPKIILEAGAIEGNGRGIILTTEQCLLKRNPNLNKADFEKIFAGHLGVSKIIWPKEGLVNDHTDGHVDEVARFAAPNKILCAYEENKKDENYSILKNNFETLRKAANLDGKPFEVIKLPMPHLVYDDGGKAPVSYANFYIGNTVVLASVFNDPNDGLALKILRDCFPDKKVVGIDCSDIIYGGGAIHCMTMQQPAV